MPQPRIRRFLKHGTLPQLKAFEAVARLGSFTRAAAELHIAQATVSGHIRKLAETADAPLFEVSARHVALTAAGHALAAAATELFATLERAEAQLASLRGGAGARLAVAAESDALFAAPLLARFAEGHPHLDVAMVLADRRELARRFAERCDDLYLMVEPPAPAPVAEPLRADPLHLVASRDHELAGCRGLPLAAVASRTLLVREQAAGSRSLLDELLRRHDLRPRRQIEFSCDAAIRRAVSSGAGIALLSHDAATAGPCGASLAALDVVGLPLPQRWFAVLPPGTASVAARAFLGVLRADARTSAAPHAAALAPAVDSPALLQAA